MKESTECMFSAKVAKPGSLTFCRQCMSRSDCIEHAVCGFFDSLLVDSKLEALERLYRSTGLIFLQWQKKFLTIIIQSLHFSSLKKKGMEKTCEKRRKKW